MTKRSTIQRSGQAMIYNFLLNEVLASQVIDDYTFWVVAPWVTNFRVPTPYHVSFAQVVAVHGDSLHLFDLLRQIAMNGGTVRMVVGADATYHPPLRHLAESTPRIDVRVWAELHAKAYAGHFGALDGSLNLTSSGLSQNAELYDYRHDQRGIAEIAERCREFFDQGRSL